MALRFYLVPLIGSGTRTDMYRPKYIKGGVAAGYTGCDYGTELTCMLVAANTTAAEHSAIIANADANAFPADLTQTIGANLATVQSVLEGYNIPAGWVTAGMTFKTLLRWLTRLFMFTQIYKGVGGTKLFALGLTPDSTVGDLSVAVRQKIQAAADAHGLSTDGITLATTLRVALKTLADQLPGFSMSGAI